MNPSFIHAGGIKGIFKGDLQGGIEFRHRYATVHARRFSRYGLEQFRGKFGVAYMK